MIFYSILLQNYVYVEKVWSEIVNLASIIQDSDIFWPLQFLVSSQAKQYCATDFFLQCNSKCNRCGRVITNMMFFSFAISGEKACAYG